MISSKELILQLSSQQTKTDYLRLVRNELLSVVNLFNSYGYNVDAQQGFIGKQALQVKPGNWEHLFLYQYFRDVFFIYHGLQSNRWTNDPVDDLYYQGLRGLVSNQYQQLPN
jgi:hypothetical protein